MEDKCPKCSTPKSGESCPKCGLVFSKFDAAVLEEGVPDDLKVMWENVATNWDDPAAHALFIEHALMSQSLGYAAICYRKRQDDPVAQEQIRRINKRLEQILTGFSSPGDKPSRSGQRTLTAIILIIITAVIVALLVYLGQKIIR